MFPIFDKETQFKNIGLKRIKSLSSRDIGAIRQYQPYITRRDKLAKVRGHLQTLERLHNIDKHRKLHVVTQSQRSAPYPLHSFPAECGFETDPTWGPVDSGDQIDRWTFVRVPPQMEEHPGATLEVAIQLGDEWVRFSLCSSIQRCTCARSSTGSWTDWTERVTARHRQRALTPTGSVCCYGRCRVLAHPHGRPACPDFRAVTILFELSRDLAAAQTLICELASQSNDLLLALVGHQLHSLGTPTKRGTTTLVATRCQLGCLPGTHPRPNKGALVLGDCA